MKTHFSSILVVDLQGKIEKIHEDGDNFIKSDKSPDSNFIISDKKMRQMRFFISKDVLSQLSPKDVVRVIFVMEDFQIATDTEEFMQEDHYIRHVLFLAKYNNVEYEILIGKNSFGEKIFNKNFLKEVNSLVI